MNEICEELKRFGFKLNNEKFIEYLNILKEKEQQGEQGELEEDQQQEQKQQKNNKKDEKIKNERNYFNFNNIKDLLLSLDFKNIKNMLESYYPSDINSTPSKILNGPVIVQVTSITNLSQPSKRQNEECNPRMIQVKVTDGYMTACGIEFEQINDFQRLYPGIKLLLLDNTRVFCGKILLTPRNCRILGGRVEHLYSAWLTNRHTLNQRKKNRNGGENNEKVPPKFELQINNKKVPLPVDNLNLNTLSVSSLPSSSSTNNTSNNNQKHHSKGNNNHNNNNNSNEKRGHGGRSGGRGDNNAGRGGRSGRGERNEQTHHSNRDKNEGRKEVHQNSDINDHHPSNNNNNNNNTKNESSRGGNHGGGRDSGGRNSKSNRPNTAPHSRGSKTHSHGRHNDRNNNRNHNHNNNNSGNTNTPSSQFNLLEAAWPDLH